MLACRAACSQPPGIGPTLYEARGPGLYMLIMAHGGEEGGSGSGSTGAGAWAWA